jgi:formyl-CoA transferase
MTAALPKKDYQRAAKGTLDGVREARQMHRRRAVAGNMRRRCRGFGAEVEEPPAGDTLRAWQTNDVQTNWKIYARNKSLCLGCAVPRARELRNSCPRPPFSWEALARTPRKWDWAPRRSMH